MADEAVPDRAEAPGASVIASSRIPISLVPERFIAEAMQGEGLRVADIKATPAADEEVVLDRVEEARRALDRAVRRWREETPPWRRLDFTLQHQQQTQWCWAAVSVSVSLYYRASDGWTQCRMVDLELERTDCCRNGSSFACNRPHPLDPPLSRAEVLDRMELGSIPFDMVRAEVDAGRPIALRIRWRGGGGHFVVVEGYGTPDGDWVAVDDPWVGQGDVAVATLTDGHYQGAGRWSHTYITRRQPPPVLGRIALGELRLPRAFWERIRAGEPP